MGRIRQPALATLFTLALPLMAVDLSAQDVERFSIDGNSVAVYNLAGSVRVEAGSGANVVVEVRRGGSDAGQLRVERREVNGQPALVVRYPEGDVVYRRDRGGQSSLNVRSDGTFFGEGRRGDRVTIRSSGRGTEAHADLRILVPAGKSLDVRLGVGDVAAAGVQGDLDIDVGAASVQTADTRGGLRIDTGSGRVRVSRAQGGDILVDTGSGSVQLDELRGDDVTIDTGSGSVSGSGITARRFHVDTGSGSIEMGAVSAGDILLDTGSGSVEVDLTSDVERLRIDTGSGGVRLNVPADLGAAIEVETGSGGIHVDAPLTVNRRERDYLSGRFGDGRGSIAIDTGSGSVRINRR